MANITKKYLQDVVLKLNTMFDVGLRLKYESIEVGKYTLYADSPATGILHTGNASEISIFLKGMSIVMTGGWVAKPVSKVVTSTDSKGKDLFSMLSKGDTNSAVLYYKDTTRVKHGLTDYISHKLFTYNKCNFKIEVRKTTSDTFYMQYTRVYNIDILPTKDNFKNEHPNVLAFKASVTSKKPDGTLISDYDLVTEVLYVNSYGCDALVDTDKLMCRIIQEIDKHYIARITKRNEKANSNCIINITPELCTSLKFHDFGVITENIQIIKKSY